MKKYVWAYISFFDNEILMGHGDFDSAVDACKFVLEKQGFDLTNENIENLQDLKFIAFNGDCMVNAYCVS